LSVILRIVLIAFHVVREWLAQWPVEHNEVTLSTRFSRVLPLHEDLSAVELIHTRAFPNEVMPSMNIWMVPEVIRNMLVQEILLVSHIG